MDRRSFLKGSAVAAVTLPAVASALAANPNGIRVSVEADDPGYRAYCLARGDGKKVDVYLDGTRQTSSLMADERTGTVKRVVLTPNGNFAHDGENVLTEQVYGDVRVVIS